MSVILNRKYISWGFMTLGTGLGLILYFQTEMPADLAGYFKSEYYRQYGPLALCIELLLAGGYLLFREDKANFTLALFGFSALLDPLFNIIGLFSSYVPFYVSMLFVICAGLSLWIAFTDTFKTGKISVFAAFGSFILGAALELFFNYLLT